VGKLYPPGTLIQDFNIVELAGDGTASNVYFAARENFYYWLLQIEQADFAPSVRSPQLERFEFGGERWMALPTTGTSIVELAGWVDKFETAFIGWRWALLARNAGFASARGAVWREGNDFNLARQIFNSQGELMFTQPTRNDPPEYAFPPPESEDPRTSASDVYALGAALKQLLPATAPRAVQSVLTRATDPNSAKRYADAHAFGDALAKVLPEPQRAHAARPPSKLPRNLILLGAGLAALCVAIFALLAFFNFSEEIAVARPEPRATDKVTQFTTQILAWTMDAQCNAVVQLRVLDDGKPLGAIDLLQFFVRAAGQPIEPLKVEKNAEDAVYTLTFHNGDFCLRGGEIRVTAQTVGKQVNNILWYYPNKAEEGSFSGVRLGSRQIITRGFPRLRMYFGMTNRFGRPFLVGGALRVSLRQDGVEVPEFQFAAVNPDTDPLTAALVIDTSGSMQGEPIARAREAAIAFVEKLNPQERVCVYRFSTEVQQLHECNTDHAAAIRALNGLTAVGNTSLYDAIVKVSDIHAARAERQAIIVLSDGDDTTSKATLEEAMTQSQRTNVPIYTIGLLNKDLQTDILRQLAERNGGSYLESPSPDQLGGLYQGIREALATQFFVEFDSVFPERKQGGSTPLNRGVGHI